MFQTHLYCLIIAFLGASSAVYFRHNPNRAILGILITGFALRLLVAGDPYLHEWDERYHALVAKNMAMGHLHQPLLYKVAVFDFDYKNWTQNHVWLHKPPFSLWLMALSMKVFGCSELAFRLPSLILSTLSIFLTFRIANKLYSDQPAIPLFAAFFQAVNGFVIELAGGRIPTDHVDTAFLFFTELGVFYFLCSKNRTEKPLHLVVLGCIIASALLTKWLAALLISFLFLLYQVLKTKQSFPSSIVRTGISTILGLSIAGLWHVFAYKTYPAEYLWEQSYNTRHIFEAIEGHAGAWWYYLDHARINWHEGVYLVVLWFLYDTFQNKRNSSVFLLAWMAVPYLVFSAVATKMNGYVVIAAPAIFISMAVFLNKASFKIKYPKGWLILTGLFFALAIRYSAERLKPFLMDTNKVKHTEFVHQLKAVLPDNANTVLFNDRNYIETMFYSDIMAYRFKPSGSELETAKSNFKKIAIVDDGNLAEYILQDSAVIKVKFPQ